MIRKWTLVTKTQVAFLDHLEDHFYPITYQTKVRIALAKIAGCLQNGSHMLLMSRTNLVFGLSLGPKQVMRAACVIHFASTQQF